MKNKNQKSKNITRLWTIDFHLYILLALWLRQSHPNIIFKNLYKKRFFFLGSILHC